MAAANAWMKREESLLLTSTWKTPCPVLEISFTFPLFAENIFRPLLAWFLLKKRLAVWSVQRSSLLQTFLKQISLMVFYLYSTIDTFCSQSEFAIDFDVITVRPEILYCFGFPSEALLFMVNHYLLKLLTGRTCDIGPFPYIFPAKTFQSLQLHVFTGIIAKLRDCIVVCWTV